MQAVRTFLAELPTEAFEQAGERSLSLPFLPEGKTIRATDYANEFALPNFSFHVVTTYAILRNNGVELGKRDYITGLTLQ